MQRRLERAASVLLTYFPSLPAFLIVDTRIQQVTLVLIMLARSLPELPSVLNSHGILHVDRMDTIGPVDQWKPLHFL